MTMDFKKAQPAIIGTLLVGAIGLGGNALYSANAVENLALANEKDIFYEKELRIIGQAVLEQDIEELKEDVREFQQEFKAETGEIKQLLNQILLQRVNTIPPTN